MIKIVVCIKQVIDPDIPISLFKIDQEKKKALPPEGTPPLLSSFDENALEAALKIKDVQEAQIFVLSLGAKIAKNVIKKTLAFGVEDVILLENEAFENLDGYSTAYVLASAIKKIGDCDLIFCGRQAADTDAGQVGPGIAEFLEIPSITVANKVEVIEGKIRAERETEEGYQIVEVPMPAVITANNKIGVLRYPVLKAVIAAQKRKIPTWSVEDIDIDEFAVNRTTLSELYIPERKAVDDQVILNGDTPEDNAEKLALMLREANII